jgi:hypothetical protein
MQEQTNETCVGTCQNGITHLNTSVNLVLVPYFSTNGTHLNYLNHVTARRTYTRFCWRTMSRKFRYSIAINQERTYNLLFSTHHLITLAKQTNGTRTNGGCERTLQRRKVTPNTIEFPRDHFPASLYFLNDRLCK